MIYDLKDCPDTLKSSSDDVTKNVMTVKPDPLYIYSTHYSAGCRSDETLTWQSLVLGNYAKASKSNV